MCGFNNLFLRCCVRFAGRPLTVCRMSDGSQLALLMREKYIDFVSATTGVLVKSLNDKLGGEKTRAWSEQKVGRLTLLQVPLSTAV